MPRPRHSYHAHAIHVTPTPFTPRPHHSRHAHRSIVVPVSHQFNADVTLVSAGFNATDGHPPTLGGYSVTPACTCDSSYSDCSVTVMFFLWFSPMSPPSPCTPSLLPPMYPLPPHVPPPSPSGYAYLTRMLMNAGNGKVAMALEGG